MEVNGVFVDLKVVGFNGNNEIVTKDNMEIIQIVEGAGASLPYIYGKFFTSDNNLADYFQQNNTLQVGIGKSASDADYFTVHVLDAPKDQDRSGTKWIIEFGGFLGPNTYMVDKISTSYTGNSLLVTKQIIKETLGTELVTDFSQVNENQVVWRQTYNTTASFVVDTLLHMDIRPSFPLFAFDKKGQFYIKSFDELIKESPKFTFVPYPPTKTNEIQYLKNFNVESFKSDYNMYSGYNKITEVCNSTAGIPNYLINENTPVLASTQQSEQLQSGNRISLNVIQSANVHNTYSEAFVYNTNKLLSLSSMMGCLKLSSAYYKEICPLDLVFIVAGKNSGSDATIDGLYLVDTVVTQISFVTSTLTTYVYVTRDNKNNVENYVTKKSKKIKIKQGFLQELANSVADVRVAAALCSDIMSGEYLNRLVSFAIYTKNTFLRIFSVADVILDFTGQIEYIKNALFVSNSLLNSLLFSIFPYAIADTLRDFLIRKPTTREALGSYIAEYVPMPIQTPISKLVDSILRTNDSLNSIAEDNGVTVNGVTGTAGEDATMANIEGIEPVDRVSGVITKFENNTTGLDIPFPLIELDESQQLLPETELENYIADETILNLEELGYMEGVDVDEFKNILLGLTPINFGIIQKINTNAGDTMNYRFWGIYGQGNEALYAWIYGDNVAYTKTLKISQFTRFYNNDYSPYTGTSFGTVLNEDGETYKVIYKDGDNIFDTERGESLDINSNALAQLTDFYINKGYKDKYRTLPCTKLISATQNARIYFACPKKEKDIKFYINSKRINLNSFPIDLGYKDIYGNSIPYLVYYTETGYNSNSVLFEVRQ